jgi:predicted outer membrane repeat protein
MAGFIPFRAHADTVTETADFKTDAAKAIELLGGAGCVEYDDVKKEITFNCVDFTTSAEVAVILPDDVTLVLQGDNRIESTYDGEYESYGIQGSDLIICGEGSLEVIGGKGANSNGFYAGSIEITEGEVTVACGESGFSSFGISASSIKISGGEVTVAGGDADLSFGISTSSIEISGGEVTATGGNSIEQEDECGSIGIVATDFLDISGGTVNATGGQAPISVGIYTDSDSDSGSGSIYISGGMVNATGGQAPMSIGIWPYSDSGSIEISGGTVTALGDTQALEKAPVLTAYSDYVAVGAKTVTDGIPVAPEPYNAGSNNEYKYFNIQPLGPIIYVNEAAAVLANGSSWDNAYTTLQATLEKAKPGQQIWVAKGTYYPTSVNGIVPPSTPNYDRYKHFQMKNEVAIYGGFAGNEAADFNLSARDFTANETILSGDIDNCYHVFYHKNLNLDDTAILDGFTITGGKADSSNYDYYCGGGMYNENSSPALTNVTFSGNSAGYGGGMSNNMSSPTLTNVIFDSNSADDAGGMYSCDSAPIMTDVTFSNNNAQYDGGGMNIVENASPVLTNVLFTGNSAVNYGGGIYNDAGWTDGIDRLLLTNAAFIGNSAGSEGGGMYNCSSSYSRIPVLTNTTFAGNSAGSESGGGGLYNCDENCPIIKNSIFWDNTNGQISGPGVADITYSLIQGYTGTGTGNISDDPMFAGANDYSLSAGSPAINAGTNEPFEPGGVAFGITTDLIDNPRIAKNTVDMGAYEYHYAIVIKTQPNKLVYTEGDTLDLTGLEVTLTYSDGSTAEIGLADFDTNVITADPSNGTVLTVADHDGKPVTLIWNSLTTTTDALTVLLPITTYTINATAGSGGSIAPSGAVAVNEGSSQTFTDCDYDAYYGKYVALASENGIIAGYGNGRFGPDDQITREQMTAIIYRFADFLGVIPDGMDTVLDYPDADSISDYAKAAALYCQTTGIIAGRRGGAFAPQETATRAEVAAIIQRFVEVVLD